MVKTQRLKRTLAGLLSAAVLTTAANAYSLPQLHARADDEGGSHPNYTEALALSLYFFDANQCGSGIKDGPLTWRGDCHTYDAQVSLDDVDGLSDSEKDAVDHAADRRDQNGPDDDHKRIGSAERFHGEGAAQ